MKMALRRVHQISQPAPGRGKPAEEKMKREMERGTNRNGEAHPSKGRPV